MVAQHKLLSFGLSFEGIVKDKVDLVGSFTSFVLAAHQVAVDESDS